MPGFYTKTKQGHTAHVLGDKDMPEETLPALHEMIEVAFYKNDLGGLKKPENRNMEQGKMVAGEQPTDLDEKKSTQQRPLTFGEKLVGLSFNPSGDPKVNEAKRLCAALADLTHDAVSGNENSEHSGILIPHTYGGILNAQMNVVKVLTLKY